MSGGSAPDRTEMPTGTVTFLFTDLEGSTRLWEESPEAMKGALARHDEIVRGAIERHGGYVVKTTGDGFHAAFSTAAAAAGAGLAAQLSLAGEAWGSTGALRVRMGIHAGSAELRDGDYYGTAPNRAARLMSAAHGGQLVLSQTTADLVGDGLPDGAVLIDLGEHRLRDLARAEQVFQLGTPGLAAEFPPLRSLDAFPGNLPLQLSSFVGRDEELIGIAKALGRERLVTLTGVGGVGKTRLAMQVAAEVLPNYGDGAWFCELAAANDDDAFVQLVAATLGVRSRQGVTLEEGVVEHLRRKQLLLVLDNCEHLLDAAATLAERLLQECAGLRVLATSREGLAVPGEQVWPVRSLPVPSRAAGASVIATSDAVRLFAARAESARPGFVLDEANAGPVAEICRRLDGIPLAIELAAARVSSMRPVDLAARLDERFRLLTGGRRTAVERHQTLRATVDWSYSLLTERERAVFDRLGVFAGSFDIGTAEEIASGEGLEPWDVVDAIASLVDKSLVVDEEAPGGSIRYSMLETLRAYARERLDQGGTPDEWRLRHARHYADVAGEIGVGLIGPNEVAWRARLVLELDDLRAAVIWALDRDSDDESEYALDIIAALVYEAFGGDPSIGIGAWAERAVDRARSVHDPSS